MYMSIISMLITAVVKTVDSESTAKMNMETAENHGTRAYK